MKKRQKKILVLVVVVSIIIAMVIMIDQWIEWGHFWDVDQALHHETFFLVLVSFAAGIMFTMILVSIKIRKSR